MSLVRRISDLASLTHATSLSALLPTHSLLQRFLWELPLVLSQSLLTSFWSLALLVGLVPSVGLLFAPQRCFMALINVPIMQC